jgi:hypothetical protein
MPSGPEATPKRRPQQIEPAALATGQVDTPQAAFNLVGEAIPGRFGVLDPGMEAIRKLLRRALAHQGMNVLDGGVRGFQVGHHARRGLQAGPEGVMLAGHGVHGIAQVLRGLVDLLIIGEQAV